MKKRVLAILALAALVAGPAMAADLRLRAPVYRAAPVVLYDWTGFYIGGHVGHAWNREHWTNPVGTPLDLVRLRADRFAGGGQIGYNWQIAAWVFGVEAQASWTHLRKGELLTNPDNSPISNPDNSPISNPDGSLVVAKRFGDTVENLGSIAGRIGRAWDRLLVYAKGGAAWVHDVGRVFNGAGGAEIPVASATVTRWGWMVGAGLEYGLAPNWSAKVEYDYMDFGSDRVSFTNFGPGAAVAPTFPLDIEQQIHLVKVGINYRFGAPVVVVAKY